jgi:hypothetical protein
MITKKELLRRMESLEKSMSGWAKHTHGSTSIEHRSTQPTEYSDCYGHRCSYYPTIGNMGEILNAILKHCGIELKVTPPTDKKIEVSKVGKT